MTRWARENDFNDLVKAASDSFEGRVSQELIKAIIAAESGFDPARTRGEPQMGDASIGLMQVLYSTARGLGYPGDTKGLFTPGTNLYLGAKLLDQLLTRTGGDLDATISAYNGGYRPDLGFGQRRNRATPKVCVRWKATAPKEGRTIARDCEQMGSTVPGEFTNQQYVTKVKSYLAYFFESVPGRPAPAKQ